MPGRTIPLCGRYANDADDRVSLKNAVPSVVFEMTSPATKKEDETTKKQLYAELGVTEYWQFDPKGEWIPQKLRGYYLERGSYQPIGDSLSNVLGLRLAVDDSLTNAPTALIAFYRLDSGEKLLVPAELQEQVVREKQRADLAQQQANLERQRANAVQQQADVERQQAEVERRRADEAERQVKALEEMVARYRARLDDRDNDP
jgi:hypothetical protein